MNLAVHVEGLSKSYASEPALKGISFDVPEGSLFGLIGADGAGKTTLIRILATLIPADRGTVTVLGRDCRLEMRGVRSEIGYMPQRFSLYPDLSVRENLLFFADVFGVRGEDRETRMERLLSFSRLKPFEGRRAAHLSGGMKQKLALSCTLVHRPRLLILDEPTTGVDPVSRDQFWEILDELHGEGLTTILSTPYMDEAPRCDELLFLHEGEIIARGDPDGLLEGYPHPLYSVTRREETISVPLEAEVPRGVEMMYPAAGGIHVATREEESEDAVLQRAREVVPEADRAVRIPPTMEDLFFLLLTRRATR